MFNLSWKQSMQIVVLIGLALALLFVACSTDRDTAERTAEGTAVGYGGELSVSVTVAGPRITSIEVLDHSETPGFSDAAISNVPQRIIDGQSLEVDIVTGATATSNAIIEATRAALNKLDFTPGEGRAATATEAGVAEDYSADVVIVGAGGFGLATAIRATEAGANVILLERMPFAGGSTNTTGRLGGRGSRLHAEAGADYTVEEFAQRVYAGGNEQGSYDHILRISERVADGLNWYIDMGYDMYINPNSPDRPEHAGGSYHGAMLVQVLNARAADLGIEPQFETTVESLITENGRVVGVQASRGNTPVTVKADLVVMATGEYGGNVELLSRFAPDWEGLRTVQPQGSDGSGILMAMDIGAQFNGRNWMVVRNGFMLDGPRVDGDGSSGIYVNTNGERFVNEHAGRVEIAQAKLDQPNQWSWLVIPRNEAEGMRRLSAQLDRDHGDKLVHGDSVAGLASAMDVPADALQASIDGMQNNSFGRDADSFGDFSGGPFVAVKIAPVVYTSLGGIEIDLDGRVLGASGAPIPGLLAGGGVTGTIGYGRSAGANHAEIAAYSVIVGETIAAELGM